MKVVYVCSNGVYVQFVCVLSLCMYMGTFVCVFVHIYVCVYVCVCG